MQNVVVQYLFEDGVEDPVVLPPHGNSKKKSNIISSHPT